MAARNSLFVIVCFTCLLTCVVRGDPITEEKIINPRLTCIARYDLRPSALQTLLAQFCKLPEVDCSVIQPGGRCFEPNTLRDHASVAINEYYRAHNFNKTFCPPRWGYITITDPARYPCIF